LHVTGSVSGRNAGVAGGTLTETGLRVYKELMPMKKEQVDLKNAIVWIPDSKTPNGIAEVPFTDLEAVSRADSDLRDGNLVVSELRESERTSRKR
jgi:hypothetical protein